MQNVRATVIRAYRGEPHEDRGGGATPLAAQAGAAAAGAPVTGARAQEHSSGELWSLLCTPK